jgi:predicted nucleotidyltransferase component of viral defense system
MKEQALALARVANDPGRAAHRLREYLQAFVLRSFHECEAFRSLAFIGGTALRFLHGLPRFSEDLDSSLVSPDGYDAKAWLLKVKRDLTLAGFEPDVTWNDRKTVKHRLGMRGRILKEAGLSDMPDQKLAIKVEIDTRPPAGAHCERQVVTRHMTFLIQHYDLPSLLSGKLHALICRKYAKGRDWYDLMWYLSQRPPAAPNLPLLQNALDQTQGQKTCHANDWKELTKRGYNRSIPKRSRRMSAPFWSVHRTPRC